MSSDHDSELETLPNSPGWYESSWDLRRGLIVREDPPQGDGAAPPSATYSQALALSQRRRTVRSVTP